jgi:predicted esterase
VLIGHSQGAGMLIHLMRQEVDPNPTQRRQMVSALLMGGNVSVPA